MSIMILSLLAVGLTMTSMDDSDLKWQIYEMHKSFGLLVLLLFPMRLTWRLMNASPHLDMIPKWEQHAAKSVHWLLYFGMLLMPLSGWIMATASGYTPAFFGLFDVPAPVDLNEGTAQLSLAIHHYGAWTLIALLSLHLAAATKAHWLDKNNILKRMLPGKSD